MNPASTIPSSAAMLVRALLIFTALWFAWPVSAATDCHGTHQVTRDSNGTVPPFQDWRRAGQDHR